MVSLIGDEGPCPLDEAAQRPFIKESENPWSKKSPSSLIVLASVASRGLQGQVMYPKIGD
jgi:hypothetical protein